MDFRNIIMEVDSQQVANDINLDNQSRSMGRHLIIKIRALLHQDIDVRIRHIYREVNTCVDALVRNGNLQSTSMNIF